MLEAAWENQLGARDALRRRRLEELAGDDRRERAQLESTTGLSPPPSGPDDNILLLLLISVLRTRWHAAPRPPVPELTWSPPSCWTKGKRRPSLLVG
jgi:hypothetical protein